jgi:uncharacterized protein
MKSKTQKLHQAIFQSYEEARFLGARYIEPTHLLLALVHTDPNLFVDLASSTDVLDSIEDAIGPEELTADPVRVEGFSEKSEEVLDQTVRVSSDLGHNVISTGHLLLGLLTEPSIAEVFNTLPITSDKVRAEVKAWNNTNWEREGGEFQGSSGITDKVIEGVNNSSPLHSACSIGDLDRVRLLLKQGSDPNLPDPHGNTPLIIASRRGHVHLIEELISAGSNVNLQDNGGFTPLMTAASANQEQSVEVLLEHGANVNATNFMGLRAYTIAEMMGHTQIMEKLERAGSKLF